MSRADNLILFSSLFSFFFSILTYFYFWDLGKQDKEGSRVTEEGSSTALHRTRAYRMAASDAPAPGAMSADYRRLELQTPAGPARYWGTVRCHPLEHAEVPGFHSRSAGDSGRDVSEV